MPPRPSLPSDDLYARLELPINASPEAIEVAWRALLRRHHPDIAGERGLEQAKRINVAHDWLSDPSLRARYDRERGPKQPATRHKGGGQKWPEQTDKAQADERRQRPAPRQVDPAEAIARFLEQVSSLNLDALDRLAAADPPPIAFAATVRRFLPLDRQAALESVEAEIERRLVSGIRRRSSTRDVIDAYAVELVLGSFLDDLLSEPFRERTRERLARGWEAAVGQPRYGPNSPAIEALISRLRGLDPSGVARLAATAARERLGEEPWPPGTSLDADEALRVSSILAGRDAAGAVRPGSLDRVTIVAARRAAARLAHLLVLRHAFAPMAFRTLTAPWRSELLSDDRRSAGVPRPG